MDEKKRKILEINKRTDINNVEKNRLIGQIMKYNINFVFKNY